MEISIDKLLPVATVNFKAHAEHSNYFDHFQECGNREELEKMYDSCDYESAWFIAEVSAEFNGFESDPIYLGCCSYKSLKEFKESDYYTDLMVEAMGNLKQKLEQLYIDISDLK